MLSFYILCITKLIQNRCIKILKEFKVIGNLSMLSYQNTSLAAKGHSFTAYNAAPPATLHRLQRRTTCKIQNGCQGAPKWPTGSGKGSNPRILGAPINFRKIIFLIWARSFYEKHRATCKIQNGRQVATKWPTGSGMGSNPELLGALINF